MSVFSTHHQQNIIMLIFKNKISLHFGLVNHRFWIHVNIWCRCWSMFAATILYSVIKKW